MGKTHGLGLVLSGGGVKGMAHLGVIKALEEEGIRPDILSGSSAGAIVGTFLAAGYEPEEVLEFFKENANLFRWPNLSINTPGLFQTEKYSQMFEPWLSDRTFESLSRPMYVCTTDIIRGEYRFFSEGDVLRPLLASAAVPGIFSPIEIDGRWYVDGGTMNNFPVEPLRDQCRSLIGIFACPVQKVDKQDLDNSIKLWRRALDLNYAVSSMQKFRECHIVLYPQALGSYGMFDTGKLEEIFQVGYDYAGEHLPEVKRALEREDPRQEDRIPFPIQQPDEQAGPQ